MLKLMVSACLATASLAAPVAAADLRLTAAKTSVPVTLDGSAEAAWDAAEPLSVHLDETTYKPSAGYDGMAKVDVEVRALYDDANLYVLVRYQDPTQSLKRWPWVKQQDGSWQQLKNIDSTGHENHYYEDKLSIFWNISEKGFAKKGCDQSCHTTDKGMIDGIPDTSTGRHYTAGPGQTIDNWHWKSARTNPVGQTDDQYINWFKKDQNPEWGRVADIKTGGGYIDNANDAKTGPAFMNGKADAADPYWILAEDKVPFVDTFKPGDMVAGLVAIPFEGPRAEVPTRGVWKDGVWTIEFKRALVTTSEKAEEEDVQFSDLSKVYPFGIAVFDNSQINHMFHKKAVDLAFE